MRFVVSIVCSLFRFWCFMHLFYFYQIARSKNFHAGWRLFFDGLNALQRMIDLYDFQKKAREKIKQKVLLTNNNIKKGKEKIKIEA